MLTFEVLKNHAGLMLIGDYTTLRCLNEVLHDVADRSPFLADDADSFLSLAYDIRKAYEGQQEVIPASTSYPEVGIRLGVKIVWPSILVPARALRVSLGYFDSSKIAQSMTYALEAVIEEGLKEDFGPSSESIRGAWERLDPRYEGTMNMLDSRGGIYCSWTKAQRKEGLAGLLETFDPTYEATFAFRTRRGAKGLVPPAAFARWQGLKWPDPHW